MKTEFETLLVTKESEHVLLVTLNRPTSANAVNTQMGRDMVEFFEQFSVASGDVRCIVLTGAGERVFCAGGDLKERKGMTDQQWMAQHAIFERMVRAIVACPVPVIAAVNGAAYGGGCEFVGVCDFAYASTQARFALTEVTLGIMPGAGGTQTLPRAVGERRAKEIVMTGTPFSAQEALAWGFVNKVCEPADLLREVLATAGRIAGNAPIAVRQARQSIHRGLQMSLSDGLAFEIEAYNRMVPTQDRLEGVLAYNEKRKPNFRGH